MAELDNSDLNLAHNGRIQRIVQQGLAPIVERDLRKAWGNGWLDELNRRRSGPRPGGSGGVQSGPMSTIRNRKGRVEWDTNTLLHAVREYNSEMESCPEDFRRRVTDWCWELVGSRNGPAHFNDHNYEQVNSDREIAYQAGVAVRLLQTFRAYRQADEIKELTEKKWPPEKASAEDKAEAERTAAPPHEEKPQVAVAQDAGPKPHEDKKAIAENEPDVVHSKRKMSMPTAASGVIAFPLAGHGGSERPEDECLGVIEAKFLPTDRGNTILPSPYGGDRAMVVDRIRQARDCEPEGRELLESVRLRFDPEHFVGPSFGLAAALADRSLRYGLKPEYEARQIIATGEIVAKGLGAIGSVGGLIEKIRIVRAHGKTGALFLLPKDGLDKGGQEIADALATLIERGITWRTIAHIDDLNDLLAIGSSADQPIPKPVGLVDRGPKTPDQPKPEEAAAAASRKPRRRTRIGSLVAASLLAATALIVGLYGFSLLDAHNRANLADLAASDDRLGKLVDATRPLAAGSLSPKACEALVKAASVVTEHDLARSTQSQGNAASLASDCRSSLQDRNDRLQKLAAAVSAARDETPARLEELAVARRRLTGFDLAQAEAADSVTNENIAAGDQAIARLKNSDGLIAGLKSSLAALSANPQDADGIRRSLAAADVLTPFDIDRLTGATRRDLEKIPGMRADLSASDRRIDAAVFLASAVDHSDTPETLQKLETAIAALTPFDLSRLNDKQKAVVDAGRELPRKRHWVEFADAAAAYAATPTPKATVDLLQAVDAFGVAERIYFADRLKNSQPAVQRARDALSASDLRLSALERAFRVYAAANDPAGQATSGVQLLAAVAGLNDLDRYRMTDTQKLAAAEGEALQNNFDASDRRITQAMTWASMATTADPSSSQNIYDNLGRAKAALSEIDWQRMDVGQTQLLREICGEPGKPSSRRMLPAIAGSDCYAPSTSNRRMLPAIKY